eukprot:CAMPEP_0197620696 /NCGR_PEP_ID=MMETSP1338-20131121/1483_1 /TAXON_ID=43686 ORGANISM="Pelagodinium beii, Strain RCC1491" /NCGR_SAMPLE_ID=MMETSP1338 /ASSEMBLY_ACC=CAM_ASM_000754 /LENGTH=118 /DNA_ID=CAMNT_0043189957 /DNA_START=439 /DNA_END=797 /DNA_ORIENTATION=-
MRAANASPWKHGAGAPALQVAPPAARPAGLSSSSAANLTALVFRLLKAAQAAQSGQLAAVQMLRLASLLKRGLFDLQWAMTMAQMVLLGPAPASLAFPALRSQSDCAHAPLPRAQGRY